MSNNLLETFREAYRNLELLPLIKEEEIRRLAVPCNPDTISELEQLIEDSPSGDGKIILAGHRGCGKSTLLAEVKRRLDDNYFTVFFSISDIIEMSDVNHINILFAMAVSLMEEAENRQINIKSSIKESFYRWFSEQTSTKIEEFRAEIETGFNFTTLLAWIKGVLKTNASIRNEIKVKFERNVNDLVKRINEIALVIEECNQQEILIIIDDIDKLDMALVNEIFKGHIKALFQPNFRLLMTIPIAALREVNLMAILETETNNQIVIMPVYKLLKKGETRTENVIPNRENMEILTAILQKRVATELIDKKTLEEIIIYSGGVLRELIRITNECCRLCLRLIRRQPDNQDIKINQEILKEAIIKLSIDFDTRIGVADYEILININNTYQPQDPKAQQFLDLLHGLYVLEYRNSELWYDLHPIIKQLLIKKRIILNNGS